MVLISPVKTNGGGILVQPRCLNLVGLQSPEGNSTEDLMQVGIKESIEGLSQTRVVERMRL